MQAQPAVPGKYWVEFTDKTGSPYCTCRPAEFLSARALQRRARAGIAVVENDLPVNPAYVQGLREQGARLHNQSRWLNAATVLADVATAEKLRRLPFVREVRYVGRHITPKNPPNRPPKQRRPLPEAPRATEVDHVMGYTVMQNGLLGLPPLYDAGWRGRGIWVAVLDGGFTNVDTLPFFDSAAAQGRIVPGWDFVERDGAVYESAQHGTSVLSVMAADLPGFFVGTAPEATYFLLKTEDTGGEFPVEETNWIAGAEWADSVGVDLLNASLGYTTFNDTTLSHRYSDLDGRTAIGSRGAAIAATKGMILFNSAGNSGDEAWRYIGVPADAPGIVAVGSIDPDGKRSSFSSTGPTPDGRLKPDLAAPGGQVIVAGNTGTGLGISSGTSLASPMLAGATASLWSAFPDRTGAEILDALMASADQSDRPDPLLGHGVPDLTKAWLDLGGFYHQGHLNDGRNGLFSFDRERGELTFLLLNEAARTADSFALFDLLGRQVATGPVSIRRHNIAAVTFAGLERLPAGAYRAVVGTAEGSWPLLGIVF